MPLVNQILARHNHLGYFKYSLKKRWISLKNKKSMCERAFLDVKYGMIFFIMVRFLFYFIITKVGCNLLA